MFHSQVSNSNPFESLIIQTTWYQVDNGLTQQMCGIRHENEHRLKKYGGRQPARHLGYLLHVRVRMYEGCICCWWNREVGLLDPLWPTTYVIQLTTNSKLSQFENLWLNELSFFHEVWIDPCILVWRLMSATDLLVDLMQVYVSFSVLFPHLKLKQWVNKMAKI